MKPYKSTTTSFSRSRFSVKYIFKEINISILFLQKIVNIIIGLLVIAAEVLLFYGYFNFPFGYMLWIHVMKECCQNFDSCKKPRLSCNKIFNFGIWITPSNIGNWSIDITDLTPNSTLFEHDTLGDFDIDTILMKR